MKNTKVEMLDCLECLQPSLNSVALIKNHKSSCFTIIKFTIKFQRFRNLPRDTGSHDLKNGILVSDLWSACNDR